MTLAVIADHILLLTVNQRELTYFYEIIDLLFFDAIFDILQHIPYETGERYLARSCWKLWRSTYRLRAGQSIQYTSTIRIAPPPSKTLGMYSDFLERLDRLQGLWNTFLPRLYPELLVGKDNSAILGTFGSKAIPFRSNTSLRFLFTWKVAHCQPFDSR